MPVHLQSRFATELPELAVPWKGAEAPEPRLLVLDEEVARDAGLDPALLRTDDGVQLLLGRKAPLGAVPVAQAYAGHQFGGWTPRLGDGRALLLGELVGPDGALRDLHLKGSGRTPFARGGDGLAALGPMLREHVVSTAVHALGIPTTRALAVVATGQTVRRETPQPGAVLARTASSHLRVGSFQFARATGDLGLLRRLADHAVQRHHPDAARAERPHLALYEAVVTAQARLVAQWMLVGFVHGVMNTDNMTISGETIDYGPCAFMEAYDPATVFSSIDETGRYAYGNQPLAAEWDLARLAEAMLPLLADDEDRAVEAANEALGRFRSQYDTAFSEGLARKLGLRAAEPELAAELLALLHAGHVDWTSFFRRLSSAARGDAEPARAMVLDLARVDAWLERWLALSPDAEAMDGVNPLFVPRNHLVEEALAAAGAGDLGPVEQLVAVLRRPYEARPGLERYAEPGPAGAAYVTYCGT